MTDKRCHTTVRESKHSRCNGWQLAFTEDILNVKKQNYYMNMGITVNEELAAKYKEAVNKRAEHIPLQHIIGYQQFFDYKFWLMRMF